MDAQYGGIWIRIGRKSIQVKSIRLVTDSPVECLELITLEWTFLVGVLELNDYTMLLDISLSTPS